MPQRLPPSPPGCPNRRAQRHHELFRRRGACGLSCQKGVTLGFAALAAITPAGHRRASASNQKMEPDRLASTEVRWRAWKQISLPLGADMTRVLVVDDDPMVCMAIEIYLERHGFEVTIADGGEAGLRALEDTSFDLMIVDIFMPHMRGFESIRIFHERAPAIPLVAMSGYAFANLDSPAPDFLRMALELGAARCLRKPFTPAALVTVINECLADARGRSAGAIESR